MGEQRTAVAQKESKYALAMRRLKEVSESTADGSSITMAEAIEIRGHLEHLPDVGHIRMVTQETVKQVIRSTGDGKFYHEMEFASYNAMRRELGFDEATPFEKALISHVALCWLRLRQTERYYTTGYNATFTTATGLFYEQRLSAAQRRYLRALTTLARIRKMQLPVLQVNVALDGGQQVNIAQASTHPAS